MFCQIALTHPIWTCQECDCWNLYIPWAITEACTYVTDWDFSTVLPPGGCHAPETKGSTPHNVNKETVPSKTPCFLHDFSFLWMKLYILSLQTSLGICLPRQLLFLISSNFYPIRPSIHTFQTSI